MKNILFSIFFTILIVTAVNAQNENSKKLFSLDGNEIGGYLGFNGKFTTINSLGAGLIDLQAAVVINHKWAVGINSSGLLNDRHLKTLVHDADYHLMGSYVGLFVERMYSINKDLYYSFSLLIGEGNVKYEYCRSVIADKKWYEEIIDQNDFYIFSPSVNIYGNIWDNLWIGLEAGYNYTTTIRMMATDDSLLNKFNGGFSIKYGLL